VAEKLILAVKTVVIAVLYERCLGVCRSIDCKVALLHGCCIARQNFRKISFELLPQMIAHATGHPAAKTVAEMPYAEAEVALFFATLPDGFDQAKAVINKSIERQLAAQAPLAVGAPPHRAGDRLRSRTQRFATVNPSPVKNPEAIEPSP
jgi:hypothetical protein